MTTLAFQGGVIFKTFPPDSGFGTYALLTAMVGPDQLPAKYLKIVAQLIAGPLTHIINSFVAVSSFPDAWKVAWITPIPKSNNSNTNSNMRPISILPVLSKVFERLTHYQ
jgi:hypothetical protein